MKEEVISYVHILRVLINESDPRGITSANLKIRNGVKQGSKDREKNIS